MPHQAGPTTATMPKGTTRCCAGTLLLHDTYKKHMNTINTMKVPGTPMRTRRGAWSTGTRPRLCAALRSEQTRTPVAASAMLGVVLPCEMGAAPPASGCIIISICRPTLLQSNTRSNSRSHSKGAGASCDHGPEHVQTHTPLHTHQPLATHHRASASAAAAASHGGPRAAPRPSPQPPPSITPPPPRPPWPRLPPA